jgi:hypothetical protein
MISPLTPPGTMIVAIDDVLPCHGLPGVTRGRYYTVARIVINRAVTDASGTGFSVVLEGHGVGVSYERRGPFYLLPGEKTYWAYPLAAFRPLDLGPFEALLADEELP